MLCIGIDMSKARFDGAVCVESVDHNPSFANNHKGFKALPQWLKSLAQYKSGCFVWKPPAFMGLLWRIIYIARATR